MSTPSCGARRSGASWPKQMMDYFRGNGATSVRTMVDAEMVDIERFFTSLGFEPASLRPFVKRLEEGESPG